LMTIARPLRHPSPTLPLYAYRAFSASTPLACR
jgi:hypothetical protein